MILIWKEIMVRQWPTCHQKMIAIFILRSQKEKTKVTYVEVLKYCTLSFLHIEICTLIGHFFLSGQKFSKQNFQKT